VDEAHPLHNRIGAGVDLAAARTVVLAIGVIHLAGDIATVVKHLLYNRDMTVG